MTVKARETNLLAVVIGVLVIIGVGMSILHYFLDPYNAGFNKYPLITFFHIVPGTIYLLLAPLQFISSIQKRWIYIHRTIGRIISAFAILVGITTFFMATVFPFSGMIESISAGVFGTIFLIATVKGIKQIRAKNVPLHREWMIRSFALGLAIATSRLIFLPFFLAIVEPTLAQIKALFISSFISAFSTHLIFAEIWIRRTRKYVHNKHYHP